jgi:hypothetical protein
MFSLKTTDAADPLIQIKEFLSSRLLFKNIKILIHKTIILSVVLCV